MKKFLPHFLIISFLFLFNACSTFFLTNEPEYVKVNGTQFELNGKPYYFTGTNLWYGCYLGSPGKTGDRERLLRELDNLKSLGITNLRVLGASEESYIKNSLKPAVQIKPGIYDEDLLEGLDFLLYEMGKREMHAVIFLNNYWEWSGGMAQYNDWANNGGGVDPGTDNYGNFMDYSATFYANEKAMETFNNFVQDLVTRKNKYSGYYYYQDPAIMSWQLANEPRPGRNHNLINEYYEWIKKTAKYIQLLDPNHLVSTGNEGLMGSLNDTTVYMKAHDIEEIDYLTFHLWPKNWRWFDAKDIEGTYDSTEIKAVKYINTHINFAKELNKPTVLEEFGIPRDMEFYKPNTATTARDKYFQKLLNVIYDSAAAGTPMAGTNVWTWGGEGRCQNENDMWLPGDPFLGDPPQEPQGLNSIYDSDFSTLKIFKEHAVKMIKLRNELILLRKILLLKQ